MRRCLPFLLVLFLTACIGVAVKPSEQPSSLPTALTPAASTPTLLATREAQAAVGKTNAAPTYAPFVPTASPIFGLKADPCHPTGVSVEYGDSDEWYHSLTISIILTNTGAEPCLVPFFPIIQLLDATGKSLEITYTFFKDPQPASHSAILVEPGQPVGFLIIWKNWCRRPVAGGIRIQVSLPETALTLDVPTAGTDLENSTIYAKADCTQPEKGSQVSVSQFVYTIPVPLHP